MNNGDSILKEPTIKMLQKMIDNRPHGDEKYDEIIDHCFRVAIELVSAAPSAKNSNQETQNSNQETQNSNQETQNSNGDLIYRADAMGTVQDHFNANGFKGYDDGQKMMDRIKALPSADVGADMKGGRE